MTARSSSRPPTRSRALKRSRTCRGQNLPAPAGAARRRSRPPRPRCEFLPCEAGCHGRTELERLSAWLSSYQVTHVAMEATGVYWKPVWAVLVQDFELLLANARHVKTVPGRKTDVNDAVWLADLLAHGL